MDEGKNCASVLGAGQHDLGLLLAFLVCLDPFLKVVLDYKPHQSISHHPTIMEVLVMVSFEKVSTINLLSLLCWLLAFDMVLTACQTDVAIKP